MKAYLLIPVVLLSGCGWFHRKPPVPDPTELIVTGAPTGSMLVVDGTQLAQSTEPSNHTQVVRVSAGTHVLEVKVGDSVTYRENVFVSRGERHVITVLSGAVSR